MIIKLFKSPIRNSKSTERHGLNDKGFRFSVGLKMMLGVGLSSIFCMGLLVYVNFQAFSQVGIETQSLMEVNASMNKDLRASIFDLQKKYLEIPDLLKVDTRNEIQEWIKNNYAVDKEDVIEGREKYRKFFSRSQRRDISKGNFVVRQHEGGIIISKGLVTKEGHFSGKLKQIHLKTTDPVGDAQTILIYIQHAVQNADSGIAVKQRVSELKNLLADEAIAAEKSRNAILYKIEDIEKKKTGLLVYRQNKKQVIGLIAVLTILLNLMLLHFMAWFVVEKPLKRLSLSIDQINKADRIHIPYQHRKDRIGVLAIALKNFQNVLTHLRDEDLRKKNQKEMIQQLIQKMAAMIESIQMKAKAMKKSAIELSTLADNTEDQTKTANESASRTVEQTSAVSYSTQQLQAAVKDISAQISKQNELVGNINEVTRASRDDMEKLTRASEEINEIVSIVKNIAGQTKLLALNARIEAARSGEAGKGFAVVAREVRALSMQTQAANEQIADKIAAIQKAGRTIIEYTQQTDIRIERLTLTSHQISVAVEEQDAFTTGISKNAHATSNDIKDVSVRISKLNDAARVTSRFAGSVQSYSEELETLLSGLLHETHEKLSKAGLTETIGGSNDVINTENQLPSSVVSNQKQTKEGRSAA